MFIIYVRFAYTRRVQGFGAVRSAEGYRAGSHRRGCWFGRIEYHCLRGLEHGSFDCGIHPDEFGSQGRRNLKIVLEMSLGLDRCSMIFDLRAAYRTPYSYPHHQLAVP